MPLKHSDGVSPNAVDYKNLESREKSVPEVWIQESGHRDGLMRPPLENAKNKQEKSRSPDETLEEIVRFIQWTQEETLIKKT